MAPATAQLHAGEFFRNPAAWRVGVDLAGMAVAGGVLAVPSFAAAQSWAPVEKRARIVAAINVLNAAFMVAGALAVALLQAFGLDLDGVFALMAVTALISAVWMFARLPTNPMRDFLSILFRSFYRLEVKGHDNIAKAGPECDHRAQPCQLPRRGAGAVRCSTTTLSSPSIPASPSAGG